MKNEDIMKMPILVKIAFGILLLGLIWLALVPWILLFSHAIGIKTLIAPVLSLAGIAVICFIAGVLLNEQ